MKNENETILSCHRNDKGITVYTIVTEDKDLHNLLEKVCHYAYKDNFKENLKELDEDK